MQLNEILKHVLVIDESQITDDLRFNSIPAWDSMAHIYLITTVEEKYNIVLENEDIVNMVTVGDLKKMILKHVNEL